MLRPRIIPCLLVKGAGLVKTVAFADPKYVGDPINAVRIFNEKEVDELIVLDIDATATGREPPYALMRHLATECRMPLCYGGGVKDVEQIKKIISYGVEKVAISSTFLDAPGVVEEAANFVGSQSVVVVLDVKTNGRGDSYEVWTHNATRPSGQGPVALAKRAEDLGAGEIVINSVDRDGTMTGYDMELIGQVREAIRLPLTVLGGAGSLEDFSSLFSTFGTIGAGAGSFFVFKGKYRAVLISYPGRTEKDALTEGSAGRS